MLIKQKQMLAVVISSAIIITFLIIFFGFNNAEKESRVDVIEEEIISAVATTSTTTTQVIGNSVEGRNIENYTFGNGSTTLLFVGGMHGGYEWNSVLLAYQFIDELKAGKIEIPESVKIEIIPNLNPDGVYKVTGKEGRFTNLDVKTETANGEGRFNSHGVDLNRNFDCKWQPTSTWKNKKVSAGMSAFSEPESQTLKKLVEEKNPSAVIFWHSQANAVYASECEKGILPDTMKLMNTYAQASGYKAVSTFDAYPVTGDAEGWLASINIPAITVELSSHENIEWTKNKAGVEALIESYRIIK